MILFLLSDIEFFSNHFVREIVCNFFVFVFSMIDTLILFDLIMLEISLEWT
jgi:hypothetical protein